MLDAFVYIAFYVFLYIGTYAYLAAWFLRADRYGVVLTIIMLHLILGAVCLLVFMESVIDQSVSLYGVPLMMLVLGFNTYAISAEKAGAPVFFNGDSL